MKNISVFVLLMLLLVSISACSGKKDVNKALDEIRTGSQGIVVSFLPNNPPAKIYAEEGALPEVNSFKVILELKNKGAYPEPGRGDGAGGYGINGKVYLSGFDPSLLKFEPDQPSADLNTKTLEGKSSINPNGGSDLVTFNGRVDADKLNVEKYEPSLLATACYTYETIAEPSACIDPNPYSTINEKKVCEVKDMALKDQGAPVAVTQINEEAFATRTQFRITVKNVGGGDIIKTTASDKCNPFGSSKLEREDIDKVFLFGVTVGNKELKCGPFAEGEIKAQVGFIRLINGEGSIICEIPQSDYGGSITAYITPISVRLRYIYRTTAERKLQINKERSLEKNTGSGASSSSQSSSTTSEPSVAQGD